MLLICNANSLPRLSVCWLVIWCNQFPIHIKSQHRLHIPIFVILYLQLENAILIGLGFAVQTEIRRFRHVAACVILKTHFRDPVFAHRLGAGYCIDQRTLRFLTALIVFMAFLENAILIGRGLAVQTEIRYLRHIAPRIVLIAIFRNTIFIERQLSVWTKTHVPHFIAASIIFSTNFKHTRRI